MNCGFMFELGQGLHKGPPPVGELVKQVATKPRKTPNPGSKKWGSK